VIEHALVEGEHHFVVDIGHEEHTRVAARHRRGHRHHALHRAVEPRVRHLDATELFLVLHARDLADHDAAYTFGAHGVPPPGSDAPVSGSSRRAVKRVV
jgi:hypothetical protein